MTWVKKLHIFDKNHPEKMFKIVQDNDEYIIVEELFDEGYY